MEKVLPPAAGQRYPLCIKGRRACPPEDVGGVWGYAYFLEAIQDPEHEEHESYWSGLEGSLIPKPLTRMGSTRR